MSKHVIRAHAARKTTHPIFPEIDKHWLTVAARHFPRGLPTKANARDPVGLNRQVYRDVRESLEGKSSQPGTFDLMNKGITILAQSVRLISKDDHQFEVEVDDDQGGIVDGAHTAKIINEAQENETVPDEQFVEVYIRTGVKEDLISDIARGLNTGMQVQRHSIYNIANVFDWLKKTIGTYAQMISWRESDSGEYDVRDLIGVLELFNIIDFPNVSSGKHPISAYEKWSIPLKKFGDDFKDHSDDLGQSKYYQLRNLLVDALILYDHIRHDFREIHNRSGGRAGKLNILEEAGKRRGTFEFPFAALPQSNYRLTKGASYPILAAFRNYVEIDEKTNDAKWHGGFKAVLRAWEEVAPELVDETYSATKEIGRTPDQLGKNRKHWDNLHMKVQLKLLRERLVAQESKRKPKSRREATTFSGGGRK